MPEVTVEYKEVNGQMCAVFNDDDTTAVPVRWDEKLEAYVPM